jgi:hypothetical protein
MWLGFGMGFFGSWEYRSLQKNVSGKFAKVLTKFKPWCPKKVPSKPPLKPQKKTQKITRVT